MIFKLVQKWKERGGGGNIQLQNNYIFMSITSNTVEV